MSQIIFGDMFDPGERDLYEDRVRTGRIKTAGGLDLVVAAVADGVGGQNKGELAAQEALNALFFCMEGSSQKEVHEILSEAAQYANQAVWDLHMNGTSCTLAVAAVYKSTLYIANVGDSRIYLCRKGKLTQLTIDHNFATVMTWGGQMDAETAAQHPNHGMLMFALGLKDEVTVDIGFYVNTADFYEANERGPSGLPLKGGDSVLVCSDGLVKYSKKNRRAPVENTQIVKILSEHEGVKAAKVLVGIASGNQAEDNVSVALIQTPDRWRYLRAQFRTYALPMLVSVVSFVALLVVFLQYNQVRSDKDFLLAASSKTAQSVANSATLIAGYTATFSPTLTFTVTPRATQISGEIGKLFSGNQAVRPFFKDEDLGDPAQNISLFVNQVGEGQDALVWEKAGSRVRFTAATDRQVLFLVFPGSDLFIETGRYIDGVKISLAQSQTPVDLSVSGSCLSIHFQQDKSTVLAACYEGVCTYSINYTSPQTIAAGKQIEISLADPKAQEGNIDMLQAQAYSSSLPKDSPAQACALRFAPTPTMLLSGTPAAPGAPTNSSPPPPATATATPSLQVTPTFPSSATATPPPPAASRRRNPIPPQQLTGGSADPPVLLSQEHQFSNARLCSTSWQFLDHFWQMGASRLQEAGLKKG